MANTSATGGSSTLNAAQENMRIKRKRKLKRGLFMASFLAWPIINFLIFYVYVHLDSFTLAFKQKDMGGNYIWVGFQNFIDVFNSLTTGKGVGRNILLALRNTMLFYGAGILISLPVSLLMGYFFHKKIFGYRFFRAVTYLPSVIAGIAMIMLFKYTIGYGGPLHSLQYIMTGVGQYESPVNSPSAIWLILFYSISFGLGGNIVVWGGAMNGVSPDILEAGELDGCNWLQEFYLIIIPSIWPTIATVILLGTVGFLGASGPILDFGQSAIDNGAYTLGYVLFEMIGKVSGQSGYENFGHASALGLLMTLISFPIAMIVKRIVYSEKDENKIKKPRKLLRRAG